MIIKQLKKGRSFNSIMQNLVQNEYLLYIFSWIGLTLVLVVICQRATSNRRKQEEAEWERIEGASAYERKHPTKTLLSSQPSGYRRIPKKAPIPGVAHAITKVDVAKSEDSEEVRALRGGEFIGNRMRFKVKVLNDSPYLIADVTIFLISYPKEALRLASKRDSIRFEKIEPKGFRSPSFDFMPTQDCVRGEIVAGVSYIDMKGEPHVMHTKPFIIRSVCDLLLPEKIKPKDFSLKLKDLECGEMVIKIDEWTPNEMYEKALKITSDANFYEVSSKLEEDDGVIFAEIHGFAKGKYTGKSVAVEIQISGKANKTGASCKLKVSGEDQAMILPAIDDLRERLSAWLCPMCNSPLTVANVEDLKEGKVIKCPFCNVPIGR